MFKVGDVLVARYNKEALEISYSAYWNTVLLVIDASDRVFYRVIILDNRQHIDLGEIFSMQKHLIHKEYECLR
jgi:hypothetical protein